METQRRDSLVARRQQTKTDTDFYEETVWTNDDGAQSGPAEVQLVDSARHHSHKLCKKTVQVSVLSSPKPATHVPHVRTLKVHLPVAIQVDVA